MPGRKQAYRATVDTSSGVAADIHEDRVRFVIRLEHDPDRIVLVSMTRGDADRIARTVEDARKSETEYQQRQAALQALAEGRARLVPSPELIEAASRDNGMGSFGYDPER